MHAASHAMDELAQYSLSRSRVSANTVRSDCTCDSSYDPALAPDSPDVPLTPRFAVESSLFRKRFGISHYAYKRVLNTGSHGKVKLATDRRSGDSVAIKVIRRTPGPTDTDDRLTIRTKVENEVACLRACHAHPHITTLRAFLASRRKFFIVTDVAMAGDLFEHVAAHGVMPEARAVKLFGQLMKAVSHMHRMGVAHRDIKPENLLLDDPSHLLVCDFGHAAFWSPGDAKLTSVAGTARCLPPEMVRRPGNTDYGCSPFPADIYCCGIVLFFLLTGAFPFEATTPQQTLRNILNRCFTAALPPTVSPEAKHLLERMLAVSPARRPSAREVLEHPWTIRRRRSTSM